LLIIYIKVFETIVVLTYVSKRNFTGRVSCLLYFTFYSDNSFKNSPKYVTFVSLV
jgi:hypothetical protein